jgi:hypothetical protein
MTATGSNSLFTFLTLPYRPTHSRLGREYFNNDRIKAKIKIILKKPSSGWENVINFYQRFLSRALKQVSTGVQGLFEKRETSEKK